MVRGTLLLTWIALMTATAFAEDVGGIPGLTKIPTSLAEAKAEADRLEKHYAGKPQPEAVKMFLAIARGSRMQAGDGWFGPGQSRHGYASLVKHAGMEPKDAKKGIPVDKVKARVEWLKKLDRNQDGRITPDDLDWSDRNPYVQQSYLVNRLFRQMDPRGEGKLTKADFAAFFDKAAKGKEHLTSDDLRVALLAGMSGGFTPGDAPTPEVLLRGLFGGEVGSLKEGPGLNAPAPDFTLKSVDGKTTIQLAKVVGPKPVVLVFGNFTCGPFRSMYPMVDEVCRRYEKDATFLMVYVREAHPTDGWRMTSNDKVGVAVAQPRSLEERCSVAGECAKLLKPAMPLLVDTIDDAVGNGYSGMPARLYVLDREGKVAYKSGRGPFGFKVGELEQALILTLLEPRP